jgi:hypothetical protein
VLKTRLNKDRILSQNEHVRTAASNELASTLIPAASGPLAKCESRLLSSKILAAEVAVVLEDLRNLLQPKNKENDSELKDKGASIVSQKKLKQEGVLQGVDLWSVPSGNRVERKEDGLPLDEPGSESNTEEADEAGWESGAIDDNEKDIDGGWQSGSLADSDSDDDEEAAVPSTTKPSKKAARPGVPSSTVIARSSAQQSTFLPSLSVGFVRGASDDSDFGEAAAAAGDIDFKKNRRGQRARRASVLSTCNISSTQIHTVSGKRSMVETRITRNTNSSNEVVLTVKGTIDVAALLPDNTKMRLVDGSRGALLSLMFNMK